MRVCPLFNHISTKEFRFIPSVILKTRSNYCGFWPSGQNRQNLRIFSEISVWSESKRTKRDFLNMYKPKNGVSLSGQNGILLQKCPLGQKPQYIKW